MSSDIGVNDVGMRMRIVVAQETLFAITSHIASLETLLRNSSGEVNVSYFTRSLAAAKEAQKTLHVALS